MTDTYAKQPTSSQPYAGCTLQFNSRNHRTNNEDKTLTKVNRPLGQDEKPPPTQQNCCIVTHSGTLCRMQVKRQCWRQTNRQRTVIT